MMSTGEKISMPGTYLVFGVAGYLGSLDVDKVCRVLQAASLIPFPEASPSHAGLVNIEGRLVAAYDLRWIFEQKPRSLRPEERFLLVSTNRGRVVIVVDEVIGVFPLEPTGDEETRRFLGQTKFGVQGVGKIDIQTVIVFDINALVAHLSSETEPETQAFCRQGESVVEDLGSSLWGEFGTTVEAGG